MRLRTILIILAIVGILFVKGYAAYDNTTDLQGIDPSAAIQQIQDNFTAITAPAAGGVTLPSGAIFHMITGSCPTGTTDVSATYSNKFLRINATAGSTGGADTHTHGAGTYTTVADTTEANATPAWNTTGGTQVAALAHSHTISSLTVQGTSASGDNVPAYLTAILCQVD